MRNSEENSERGKTAVEMTTIDERTEMIEGKTAIVMAIGEGSTAMMTIIGWIEMKIEGVITETGTIMTTTISGNSETEGIGREMRNEEGNSGIGAKETGMIEGIRRLVANETGTMTSGGSSETGMIVIEMKISEERTEIEGTETEMTTEGATGTLGDGMIAMMREETGARGIETIEEIRHLVANETETMKSGGNSETGMIVTEMIMPEGKTEASRIRTEMNSEGGSFKTEGIRTEMNSEGERTEMVFITMTETMRLDENSATETMK